jgi:hypothetical protein
MRILRTIDYSGRDGLPQFSENVMVLLWKSVARDRRRVLASDSGRVFVVGGSEAHEYSKIKDLCRINILFLPESTSGLVSNADMVHGGDPHRSPP